MNEKIVLINVFYLIPLYTTVALVPGFSSKMHPVEYAPCMVNVSGPGLKSHPNLVPFNLLPHKDFVNSL